MFDRLRPGPTSPTAAELLTEVRPRERAPADRPFVYLNMVSTIDGRAALDGRTSALGNAADLSLLVELREMADAVLIGSGTLRAEGYGRLMRRADRRERRRAAGVEPEALAVLISRSMDLPWDAGLFAAEGQPVHIYTQADGEPPDVAADVEATKCSEPFVAGALRDLRERGVRALLCEGGPTLNGALLAAGVVDELFLTVAPLLAGIADAPRIVEGEDLSSPIDMELVWTLRHEDELYLRYRIR